MRKLVDDYKHGIRDDPNNQIISTNALNKKLDWPTLNKIISSCDYTMVRYRELFNNLAPYNYTASIVLSSKNQAIVLFLLFFRNRLESLISDENLVKFARLISLMDPNKENIVVDVHYIAPFPYFEVKKISIFNKSDTSYSYHLVRFKDIVGTVERDIKPEFFYSLNELNKSTPNSSYKSFRPIFTIDLFDNSESSILTQTDVEFFFGVIKACVDLDCVSLDSNINRNNFLESIVKYRCCLLENYDKDQDNSLTWDRCNFSDAEFFNEPDKVCYVPSDKRKLLTISHGFPYINDLDLKIEDGTALLSLAYSGRKSQVDLEKVMTFLSVEEECLIKALRREADKDKMSLIDNNITIDKNLINNISIPTISADNIATGSYSTVTDCTAPSLYYSTTADSSHSMSFSNVSSPPNYSYHIRDGVLYVTTGEGEQKICDINEVIIPPVTVEKTTKPVDMEKKTNYKGYVDKIMDETLKEVEERCKRTKENSTMNKENNNMNNFPSLNIFGQSIEFGVVNDPNIASTLMGVAVKKDNNWHIFDKESKVITDMGTLQIGNFPIMITPCTKLAVGDLIRENNEYYYVISFNDGITKVLSVKTGEYKEIAPIHNIFGIKFYSRLVTFESSFRNILGKKGQKKGIGSLIKMGMMSQMMSGENGMFNMENMMNTATTGTNNNNMMQMMTFAFMMKKMGENDIFSGLMNECGEDGEVQLSYTQGEKKSEMSIFGDMFKMMVMSQMMGGNGMNNNIFSMMMAMKMFDMGDMEEMFDF